MCLSVFMLSHIRSRETHNALANPSLAAINPFVLATFHSITHSPPLRPFRPTTCAFAHVCYNPSTRSTLFCQFCIALDPYFVRATKCCNVTAATFATTITLFSNVCYLKWSLSHVTYAHTPLTSALRNLYRVSVIYM